MGPRPWAPHFLVFFSLYIASACAQGCQVVLQLWPANSTVSLGGALVAPVQAPLEPGNPGAATGLSGDLVANLDPCPTDAAALASALSSAQLSTTLSTGPLLFYPSEISVKNDFATLEWQEVGLNASVQLSSVGASTVQLIFAEGWVNNTSLLTPNGERLDPIGINGTNVTTATVQANGAEVTLTLTDFVVTMPSSYTGTLNGAPLEGLTNYVLSGTIVASTAVGCPSDCGANGRCAALEDGTANCQCACGWSGAACDVPSGFCPVFPSDAGAAAANCPTLPPAPPPDSTPCSSGAQCTSWEQWNATSGGCQCLEGWGGPGCDACETNDACGTRFSNDGATCSSSRLYTAETVYKAYTCDLEGSGLDDVIEPGTFFVSCNTTAPTVAGSGGGAGGATVADGSFCTVDFALKGRGNNPVSCKSSLCAFQSNSSIVNCQTTSCSCRSACPDLAGVFARIEGQPTVIDCDDAGQCVFDIKDFFVTLKAPCTNHACLVPGYVMEEGAFTYSPDKDYNPLLAALPLIALVTVAAVLTAHMLVNRPFFKASAVQDDVISTVGGAASAKAGSRLHPVDPVGELSFTDICSMVRLPGGAILNPLQHVSGVVRNGELAGVLGPSGGGKTSLLSVLVGSAEDRSSSASVSGTVTLDGAPLDAALAMKMAYCAQDSTLLPTLTVEECVRYSALLRLPRGTSAADVATVVSGVLEELGLQKIKGSQVGGSSGLRGVSGGERRRVAIAMELVTNPAILVCDEPTSGLDSYTSYSVMRILKTVAASGRIVIMSFHQPSPAMFSLLDRVFLMVQGRCAFAGAPEEVAPRFAAIGLPCPAGVSAAEHMLYCACDPETAPVLLKAAMQGAAAGSLLSAELGNSDSDKGSADAEAGRASGGETVPTKVHSAGGAAQVAAAAAPAVGRQLAVLFWRALVDIARNPTLLLLHWAMAAGMGLLTGCIFFSVGLDISGAQDRLGGVFFALAFFAFTSLTTTDLLMTERRVVSREVRGGYYAPWTYLASKAVLDGLLLRAIPTFLYAAAFYPMMGLNGGSDNVAVFLMTLATFAVAVGALSLAVAVGAGTPGQASLIMNLVLLLSLLMGGFFVNVAEIPDWVSWLHYFSVFYYGYAVLVTNEMSTLLLNFEVEGYAAVQNVRGTTFLEIIGVDPKQMTTYIIVLDCMYVAFLLLAFALLHVRVRHLFPSWNFMWSRRNKSA